MERLVEFAELREKVRKVERLVSQCQHWFIVADDYADRFARRQNLRDLNAAVEAKQKCIRVVVDAEDVCRKVGEFFVELSAFDDVEFYAQTFELLTVAQEVVRDCLEWYRLLCESVDKVIYAD